MGLKYGGDLIIKPGTYKYLLHRSLSFAPPAPPPMKGINVTFKIMLICKGETQLHRICPPSIPLHCTKIYHFLIYTETVDSIEGL